MNILSGQYKSKNIGKWDFFSKAICRACRDKLNSKESEKGERQEISVGEQLHYYADLAMP